MLICCFCYNWLFQILFKYNHIFYSNTPNICSNALFKDSFHVLDTIPRGVSILTKADKIPSPHGVS